MFTRTNCRGGPRIAFQVIVGAQKRGERWSMIDAVISRTSCRTTQMRARTGYGLVTKDWHSARQAAGSNDLQAARRFFVHAQQNWQPAGFDYCVLAWPVTSGFNKARFGATEKWCDAPPSVIIKRVAFWCALGGEYPRSTSARFRRARVGKTRALARIGRDTWRPARFSALAFTQLGWHRFR